MRFAVEQRYNTRMEAVQSIRRLLPFVVFVGMPTFALGLDAFFGFPMMRYVFADAIAFVESRGGFSPWALLLHAPGLLTLLTLMVIIWRRNVKGVMRYERIASAPRP